MTRSPLSLPGEPSSSHRFQRRKRRSDAGVARPNIATESRERMRLGGRPKGSGKATPEKLARLTVLRAQGLSHRDIAKQLGVSRTAVSDWLARGGL